MPTTSKAQGRTSAGSGRTINGLLTALTFLPVASRAPQYSRLIYELVRDERVPMERKALVAAALGYIVSPIDLIPDRVPILGVMDDIIVVVLAFEFFMDGVPDEVLQEKLVKLGIDRAAFDQDLSDIRRATPAPIRRLLRRVPAAINGVREAVRTTGIAPKVRDWITKEGPHA
jgi:uncharacterized membrane protein YkvA (DUF1232 family)